MLSIISRLGIKLEANDGYEPEPQDDARRAVKSDYSRTDRKERYKPKTYDREDRSRVSKYENSNSGLSRRKESMNYAIHEGIKTEYPDDDNIGKDEYDQDEYESPSSSLREYASSLMKSNGGYNGDYSKSSRLRQSLKIKEEDSYDDGYYIKPKVE